LNILMRQPLSIGSTMQGCFIHKAWLGRRRLKHPLKETQEAKT